MNYIDLINKFWRLDEEHSFNGNETRLFFFLVRKCNSLRWKNPFANSDGHTSSMVGVSINTLKTCRNRLKQAGLIDFKPGGRGARNKCIYEIKVSNVDTLPDTLSDETLTPYLAKTDDISKRKHKRKHNTADAGSSEKGMLTNPFGAAFLPEWEKWKKFKSSQFSFKYKTVETEQAALDDLYLISSKDEATAIKIIGKSIAKAWKGLFPYKDDGASIIPLNQLGATGTAGRVYDPNDDDNKW